jgi:methylisocitrate lyase
MTTKLRNELARSGALLTVSCYDPLTARIAEDLGFRAVTMQGWITGASLCIPEPLLSLTDLTIACKRITDAVQIPLIVDAGAGFGDEIHVIHTVRQFELAGAAGIHIEDQVFPKRARYHAGVKYIISKEEMVSKIKAAVEARKDDDFVVVGRTDALQAVGGGIEEAIDRAKAYREAGADIIMTLPRSLDDMRRIRSKVEGDLWVSPGTYGPTTISVKDCEASGFKIVNYPLPSLLVAAEAVMKLFRAIKEGDMVKTLEHLGSADTIQEKVKQLIGIPELVNKEIASGKGIC